MRMPAALLALALGACSYTDPNPWDTSDDVEEYREKTEENWQYEVREPYRTPQHHPKPYEDTDLEAWRDTVLANADADTLRHIRTWTVLKLERIKGDITRWYKEDRHTRRIPVSELQEQYRIETARLKLLEEREASGAGR